MCDTFLILRATYFTGDADDSTPFVVRDNNASCKNFRGNRRRPFKLVFE